MYRKIITVISSKIESPLEEWVKIFHSQEADLRHFEFDIKPFFRIFNIDDSKKFICTQQTIKGNIQKFVQANSEWIKSLKVDFSTLIKSSWI